MDVVSSPRTAAPAICSSNSRPIIEGDSTNKHSVGGGGRTSGGEYRSKCQGCCRGGMLAWGWFKWCESGPGGSRGRLAVSGRMGRNTGDVVE